MAVTAHYDTPEAWASGADRVYEALGRAIVEASPIAFHGRTIADLGAGTGATSRAIAAAGGRPLALDLSRLMLAHDRVARPPVVVADITALPLADGSVGGAVAAFSLSHVDDPGGALREAARITEPGGPILAGVFAATGVRHEVKTIVESLATQRGWTPPPWYLHLKEELEPRVADVDELVRLATAAGLAGVDVTTHEVDAGLDTVDALVNWRLSGPHMGSFVDGLTTDELATLRDEARQALGAPVQPLRPAVRILSSVAPAPR
jgi:ubiquinone/menaquinone biosynthesis C-methylase UbiE